MNSTAVLTYNFFYHEDFGLAWLNEANKEADLWLEVFPWKILLVLYNVLTWKSGNAWDIYVVDFQH